jgi:threonine dehydratase
MLVIQPKTVDNFDPQLPETSLNQITMAEISSCPPLTRESVVAARQLILPLVHKTPVMTSSFLNKLASTSRDPSELGEKWQGRKPAAPKLRLWFKCENFQRGGAFKARGAFHAVERLKMEPGWAENGGREKGVATHSSGQHAPPSA